MNKEITVEVTSYNLAESEYQFIRPPPPSTSLEIYCFQEVNLSKVVLPEYNSFHYYENNLLIVVRWSKDLTVTPRDLLLSRNQVSSSKDDNHITYSPRMSAFYPRNKLFGHFRDLRLRRGAIMFNLLIDNLVPISIICLHNMRDGSVEKRVNVLRNTAGQLINELVAVDRGCIVLGGGDFNINLNSIASALRSLNENDTFHIDENTFATYKYHTNSTGKVNRGSSVRHTTPIDHTFYTLINPQNETLRYDIHTVSHGIQNPESMKISDHLYVTETYRIRIDEIKRL